MSVGPRTGALPEVFCVCGPTASGKTALAIELARRLDGEIVSADSMQIYKYMDIGTAKPTPAERALATHHLIDFLEPSEEYSVAQYAQAARAAISDIVSRGKVPVLCGGTGQYVSALVENLEFSETASDPELRAELTAYAAANGTAALNALLAESDPEAAERIHPNDLKRNVRALEMYRLTGKTLARRNLESRGRAPFAKYRVYGVDMPRDELYRRIDRRVGLMLEAGLVGEAQELKKHLPGRTASQAIGYKELDAYFNGESTLEEAAELIARRSRNYAKRQLTWFRHLSWVEWRTPEEFAAI